MINTKLINNMEFKTEELFDVIFADYLYESTDFSWVTEFWNNLKPNGVFIAMTDFHSSCEYEHFMRYEMKNSVFVNHLVWKNEWGNHPKNRFHQCYDDIIIYSNGDKWKFYSDKIQVNKVTKSKGMNPSGRTTKTATAWVEDITLTTTAKERVKKEDGHLVKWQKPLRLYDRIISPFVDKNDTVLDIFMGSGSLGLWCKNNEINYLGLEDNKEVYDLAIKNIGG